MINESTTVIGSVVNLTTVPTSLDTIDDGYDYLWSDIDETWANSNVPWDRLRFQTNPTFAVLTNQPI
jgi:hypothetical protein